MDCFAFHFRKFMNCIIISLSKICYKFIEMKLCNIIELYVLDHQVPHAILVLNFFILHVTHCNNEDRPEGWIVHMASVELQVHYDHHDADPSPKKDT